MFLLILVILVVFYRIRTKRHFSGPFRYPIIGNLTQIPLYFQHKTFSIWSKTYGDIIHIQILNQPIIILNSYFHANILLNSRSQIYSDRPSFTLLVDLYVYNISSTTTTHSHYHRMGWDNVLTHFPYGQRMRKHRRLIHSAFSPAAIPSFVAIQHRNAAIFLGGLLRSPHLFEQHIKRYTTGTILRLTYGHNVMSLDDIHVRTADRAATATVQAGSPGSMLVDFIPARMSLHYCVNGNAG
jgi:Cytochrome P450